ncbi:hypothetical protein KP509_18G077400 [Ceratopteris richardii]|nr:hypothetical protein KP509_18G077400 [Ceratopteris richardii]
MYAKCGALAKAQQILKELPIQNVVSWSALIAGFTEQGKGQNALNCYYQMQHEGLSPDPVTYISVLRACGSIGATEKGEEMHYEILNRHLLGSDIALGNALVTMYANCGALNKAQQVLNELPNRDVISWSALIAGYAKHGQGQNALNCFEQMQSEGLSPNIVTFISILKACGSIRALDKGEQVHEEISRQGLLGKDCALGNALVDMYAKCGDLKKAQQVFEELPSRDVVTWSALISGYTQQGLGQNALDCYGQMCHHRVSPTEITFVSLLKACASIGAIDKGEQIHNEIVNQGLLGEGVAIGNALVDMYAKCGVLTKAAKVLNELPVRDVVSWSTLISGYIQHHQVQDALICFERMQQDGLSPDAATFTSILKACANLRRVDLGRLIHIEILRQGLLESNALLGTALVDMYAKCGMLAKAQDAHEVIQFSSNNASWNALISGFVQQGLGKQAFFFFEEMLQKGPIPNEITFSAILKACGSIGDHVKGQQIHNMIVRRGISLNHVVLGAALVDMYAKCGVLKRAQRLLDELPAGNVVSWSALISGFAQEGLWEDAVKCFQCMLEKGLTPNRVTFSSMLHACSHSGLVDEGLLYFANMAPMYGIVPDSEHYTCMVDLLGRAGHFEKATELIQRMPTFQYPALWSALLGACQKWGDVTVGKWAFEQAIQVYDSDSPYLCMFNIYTAAGMHEAAKNIQVMRLVTRARKFQGPSAKGLC